MAGEIRQFSEDASRRIADAVRQVESSPVLRSEPGGSRPSPQARVLRWGRTTTSYEHPTYPSSGPAYVVELGDYEISPSPVYPGATVSKTFTPYSPEWKVIAVDPDNGTHEQGSVVRIERHGPDWWIRPAAGAATHPVVFQDEYAIPATTTGVGTGTSPNFYTMAYSETLGSRADNHVNRLDLGASGDPCFEVLQTGAYRIVFQAAVTFDGGYPLEDTLTTSGPSTGTSHTHTVSVYQGKQTLAGWKSYLDRRVGGSGSWTYIGASLGEHLGVFNYWAGSDPPVVSISHECYLNLTAGWQLRHIIAPTSTICESAHRLKITTAKLLIHYLGEQLTADTT